MLSEKGIGPKPSYLGEKIIGSKECQYIEGVGEKRRSNAGNCRQIHVCAPLRPTKIVEWYTTHPKRPKLVEISPHFSNICNNE